MNGVSSINGVDIVDLLFHPNMCSQNQNVAGHYSHVIFRISGKCYELNSESINDKQRKAFTDEVERLLTSRGWTIVEMDDEDDIIYATLVKGSSEVGIYPEVLCGVVENSERLALEKLFAMSKTFILDDVVISKEFFEMTDDQLEAKLEACRDKVRAEVLNAFTTKRRDLYMSKIKVIKKLARNDDIYLMEKSETVADGVSVHSYWIPVRTIGTFILKLFDELVDSGEIVSAETRLGTAYRAAKKDELKLA